MADTLVRIEGTKYQCSECHSVFYVGTGGKWQHCPACQYKEIEAHNKVLAAYRTEITNISRDILARYLPK